MQRELKFRIWDKKLGNMYTEPCYFKIDGKGDLSERMFGDFSILSNKNDYEIMQFTGLQDSEGNDIYEADLMENCAHTIFEVFFSKGSFCLKQTHYKNSPEFTFHNKYSPELTFHSNQYLTKYLKVVGNIYQNKDLLTNPD